MRWHLSIRHRLQLPRVAGVRAGSRQLGRPRKCLGAARTATALAWRRWRGDAGVTTADVANADVANVDVTNAGVANAD
eukprot:8623155-Alexandrium_andersonii.AAC.1